MMNTVANGKSTVSFVQGFNPLTVIKEQPVAIEAQTMGVVFTFHDSRRVIIPWHNIDWLRTA